MAISEKYLVLQSMKLNAFLEQDEENGFFDVVFEVEDKKIHAHKTELTLVSPTFASMLSRRWKKNQDEPVIITDCSYDNFYQFLIFLYSGECQLTNENIFSMVDMAEFYGVPLFKDYCDQYLAAMEITTENIFSLVDLVDKYSLFQLKASVLDFIKQNFQDFVNLDDFKKVGKSILKEIISAVQKTVKAEDLFLAIHKWCEHQANEKLSAAPEMNLNDLIKLEFDCFRHEIYFRGMNIEFLHEFVIPRGYIFSSLNELSRIICDRYSVKKVKVTNACGQTLSGYHIPDKSVADDLKSINSAISSLGEQMFCWWFSEGRRRPSTPSPLKKRNGVEWYLIYDPDGVIGIKKRSWNFHNDFLIAEMFPGDSGFRITPGCKIEVE